MINLFELFLKDCVGTLRTHLTILLAAGDIVCLILQRNGTSFCKCHVESASSLGGIRWTVFLMQSNSGFTESLVFTNVASLNGKHYIFYYQLTKVLYYIQ